MKSEDDTESPQSGDGDSEVPSVNDDEPQKPKKGKGQTKKAKKAEEPTLRETTLTELIDMSLKSSPALKKLYNEDSPVDTSQDKERKITAYLNLYWRCVKKTWPEIWKMPSSKQRLTHKAGLIAMTKFMPVLMDGVNIELPDAESVVEARLKKIKGIPWDSEEMLRVIGVGRTTEGEFLYKGIQSLYNSEVPQTEITLKDTKGIEHKIKLAPT